MQEQLINFETAKLAYEKGFDEPTKFLYNQWSRLMPEQTNAKRNSDPSIGDRYFHACSQSLLQKWLREVHGIDCNVLPYNTNKKFYEVYVDIAVTTWSGYDTYEEALEIGLQEALKAIKIQK